MKKRTPVFCVGHDLENWNRSRFRALIVSIKARKRDLATAAVVGAASILLATGAAAQDRWTTGFRQGFSFATLNQARGPMLQLSCDTSGLKPGRGSVIVELRAPKGAVAAPAQATEVLLTAAGQIIRVKAQASVATARDAVPGSARRRNGETLVDTRASQTEDAVTLAYDLDGTEAAAQPLAALAAAIAKEPREITVRAPTLNLETKFPSRQAAPAMRGFDKGCQDALPPADEELQWDWQQGLDRVDDKLQVTLAAAADEGGPDAPKLILRCASGPLQAIVTGWRRAIPPGAPDEERLAAAVTLNSGERIQSLWTGRRGANNAWTLEGDAATRFIASLWRGARLNLTSPRAQAAHEQASFPIAGVPLATRKLIEACPTPLLPPQD